MDQAKAIVLFGHGARDPQWADPMRRLQHLVREKTPHVSVELAFLELMEPSLPDCVNTLVAQGAKHIQVVPIFFGQGGHLKNDFPKLMQSMQAEHPQVNITATQAVGQWDAVWQAIANQVVVVMGSEKTVL